MLRALLILLATSVVSAPPVLAQGQARAEQGSVQALSDALQIGAITEVMRDEGLEHGAMLEEEMFPGAGGARWKDTVAHIYDAPRARREFDAALTEELAGRDLQPMLDFFAQPPGNRIVPLEIEARRALMDEAVEDAARLRLEEMTAEAAPRLEALRRFADVNGLVEMNVAGALNTNLAFYKGMAAAGAFGDMPEDQMLADVWAQEDAIRTETETWLFPYLALAYEPLSDTELDGYIAFSETEAGQVLNGAIFAAFDKVFARISHELGEAAGRHMQGQDI